MTKLAEEQTGWRKVLLISVVAFCIGTFSAFRTKGTNADILYFIQSRDFTILVVISGLLTVILADLLGVLSKKGDGWKIGIVGIVALHFGVLAVFYPIF